MKRWTAILLALVMLFACAACGNTDGEPVTPDAPGVSDTPATTQPTQAPADTEEPQPETRTITDFYGNELEIPANATKIATGKTVATHIVAIVGGTDALACLGQGFNYTDGQLCKEVFPGLEGLTEYADADFNVEVLLELDPDVVYLNGGPDGTDVGEQLKQAGIAVAYCNLASSQDIIKLAQLTADILGTEEAAANAEAYISYYLNAIEETKVDAVPEPAPLAAYSRGPRGICGVNSMPNEWITGVGGKNAGEQLNITAYMAEVTVEEMLNLNPDIIFCESPQAKEMYADPQYAGLSAVQNDRLYIVPMGMSCSGLATSENPIVWYYAANILYPDTFDYDLDAILSDFFSRFYGYELSQEQIDAAMHR